MQSRRLPLLAAVAVAVAVLMLPAGASAQLHDVSVDVSIGAFRHQSDLHTYYPSRFNDATSLGVGVSFPLHRYALGRVVMEWVSTQLSGGPVWTEAATTPDRIHSAEFQVLGLTGAQGRLRPYAGAGAGLRRYTVNTWILSDDVVYRPWQEPQVQPALSAIAGLRVAVAPGIGLAADLRWSRARFRAGEDAWGLPEDPVQWQTEFRPSMLLEWTGRRQ
jgi:opacity protein-like surface antigen